MSYSLIGLEKEAGGIARLTIRRPEKLNALSQAVMAEIDAALAEVHADAGTGGLIVTGAGDKAFVAGADIAELAAATPLELHRTSLAGQRTLRRLEQLAKPSVAAINGYAFGGGLELAMACTVRFAAENAKLGQPEVKLGLIAGYGGTQRLPQLVGRGRALALLLSGETVDAAEACRIGLVNAVVPQAELLDYSRAWLARVLAHAPLAIGLTMDAVDMGYQVGLDDGLRYEAAAFAIAAASDDRKEGTAAFLAKRPAIFSGK